MGIFCCCIKEKIKFIFWPNKNNAGR